MKIYRVYFTIAGAVNIAAKNPDDAIDQVQNMQPNILLAEAKTVSDDIECETTESDVVNPVTGKKEN